MDDIFFNDRSDKDRRPKRPGKNDLFSVEPETELPPKKENFVVHLPESERQSIVPNRTPKGQPLAAKERTPAGPPEYTPVQFSAQDSPAAPTRAGQPRQQPPGGIQTQRPQQRPQQQMPHRPQQPSRSPGQRQPYPAQRSQQNRPAQRGTPQKRRKKRSTGKIIVAVICILLVVSLLGGFAYGYSAIGHLHYDKKFVDQNAYIDESTLMTGGGVKNILLLGSDARGDVQGQRTDTMLICSIDSKHHKVKLTSLLRDSYVYIPSKGYSTKLNAAFSYGGPQLLLDTIEYNFKIKLDGYILIDFEGFTRLIDLMGGLDIDGVTEAEAKYLRETVKILYAKEGKNHFSGAAALWYCRIRYLDNDFKRTERQRKVIGAIVKQAVKTKPARMQKIIKKVLPKISTSLTQPEVLTTGISAVFNYIGGENPQHQVPADGTWSDQRINGAAVLKLDTEENIRLLKAFIYE